MRNFDTSSIITGLGWAPSAAQATASLRLRRALLASVGLAPLYVGLASPQAFAQAPVLAQAPKLLANWAALQLLARGQAMQPSGSLRLAVPAVAAAGDMALTIGSELPGTTLLALFVQTQGLQVPAPLNPAQLALPPALSAEQMGLRSVLTVFDCSHPDTKPEFSVPVKFQRTSRFYLVAIAADRPYLVEAETKLAYVQRP